MEEAVRQIGVLSTFYWLFTSMKCLSVCIRYFLQENECLHISKLANPKWTRKPMKIHNIIWKNFLINACPELFHHRIPIELAFLIWFFGGKIDHIGSISWSNCVGFSILIILRQRSNGVLGFILSNNQPINLQWYIVN